MNKLIAIALVILATLAIAFSQDHQGPRVSIIETNVPQGQCKGKSAGLGDLLSLKYTGKFEDGTVFDSSDLHGGAPFNFTLGERKVIPGMEIGSVGLCEGEIRTFLIPYQLAYGEEGIENAIPPKSNLIFTVELVAIESAPAGPFYLQLIPSTGTIIAFTMLGAFIVIVKYILNKYPSEENVKKPVTAGKPKKIKSAKQN